MPDSQIKAFVFTDIVGSTSLKLQIGGQDSEQRNARFAREILGPYRHLIESRLDEFEGRLISTQGDGNFLEFRSPIRAVIWALDIQKRQASKPIHLPGQRPVAIKIAIHVGPASTDPDSPENFVGTSVDYAARLVKLATGSQILVSEVVATMIRDEELSGVMLHNHGEQEVAGIGQRPVYELVCDDRVPGQLVSHRLERADPKARGHYLSATQKDFGKFKITYLLLMVLLLAGASVAVYRCSKERTVGSRRVLKTPDYLPAARHFLLTLPGMKGGWWFDELPWFSPEIRGQLLQHLTVDQYQELRRLSAYRDVDHFYSRLAELCEESLQGSRNDAINQRFEMLRDARSFDEVSRTAPGDSPWSVLERELVRTTQGNPAIDPESLHLLALVKWKINKSDAETLLLRAREAYHGRNPELKALCIADTAIIDQRLQRPRDAVREFSGARAAVPQNELSPAMNLFTLAMEAEARLYDKSKPRQEIPPLLQLAATQKFAPPLDEDHPLLALVRSREALYHLEIWELKKAEQQGIEAQRMFVGASADRRSTPLAFRSRQFVALSRHFQGKARQAEDDFRQMLQFIQELTDSDQIADREKPTWRRLRPNLLGRLADVQLFGNGEATAAAETLQQAAREASWFKGTPKAAYLARIEFKRAIALSLSGSRSAAEGAYSEAQRIVQGISSPLQHPIYTRYLQVSKALLEEDPKSRSEALMVIIDDALQEIERHGTDRLTRDDRQLELLLCRLLLNTENDRQDLSTAQKARVRRLEAILSYPLQQDGQEYLKRLATAAEKLAG